MPKVADWRSGAGYEPDEAMDWPQIAMGYLTRNDDYRAEHAKMAASVSAGTRTRAAATELLVERWGISVPADVELTGDTRQVIVPPAASPATLMLAALSPSRWTESDAQPLELPVNVSSAILRQLVVSDREGDHRLWITSGPARVLLLPLDTMLAQRLAAALRLCRRLEGKPSGPPATGPSSYQQHRHLLLYRLLDGQQDGARPRELACNLIDRAVTGYSAAEWADCRQRKQIMRWMVQGKALVARDYLRLLRGEIRHSATQMGGERRQRS